MEQLTLMQKVALSGNIWESFRSVKANNGCPGIDGMTIQETEVWLQENMVKLCRTLNRGLYLPKDLLKIEIPKPNGGVRKLGIPTVLDRVVQETIRHIIEPLFDQSFSDSSHGFRRDHSQHTALKQAQGYVREGLCVIVDIDLKQFFDNIDHGKLMMLVAPKIRDKLVSRLITRFLKAGERLEGERRDPRLKHYTREKGAPQGGPLSPFLSNVLLDRLDKFLEKKDLKFVRYADDCRIFVKTEEEGWIVYWRVVKFLEGKLNLPVNEEKSQVDDIDNRPFLGYKIERNGELNLSDKAFKELRSELRQMTQRNRLIPKDLFVRLNSKLRGWVNYFRLIVNPKPLRLLDGRLRQRLRVNKLKSLKTRKRIFKKLWQRCQKLLGSRATMELRRRCLMVAKSGKGWVRRARARAVKTAYSNSYFIKQGLLSLELHWRSLKLNN